MCIQGRREGDRGGGNTRVPECSEGPGNHGKMFVYCLSSAISRGTGARVHKSSFCPGARGWLSPALFTGASKSECVFNTREIYANFEILVKPEVGLTS
jgi:hypothetical protein